MLYGDGKVRKCIPVLSTWLANHIENVNIYSIKTNWCPVCIATLEQVGVLSIKPLAMHNWAAYESLFLAGDMERYVSLVHKCGSEDS